MSETRPARRRAQDLAQQERNERMARLLREDLAFLMGLPQFRRFALKLLEDCYTFRSPMTGNGWTPFNCGKQAVGQALFGRLLEVDDDFLGQFRREWFAFVKKEGL